MTKFEAAYAAWVLRNRALLVVACLILIGILGYGNTMHTIDTSYRAFFSEDNPQLLAFERIENTYVKDDNVLFVLAPKDENVFTRETLSAIEELTAAAWQMPYSNRVDSISNFQFTEAEEDDLIVRDMVKNAQDMSASQLAKVRENVMGEPSLVKRLISEAGDVTSINITIQMPLSERSHATQEIAGVSREMIKEFEQKHPDIKVHLTGMVMFDQAFLENGIRDTTILFPVSLVLMVGLLALLAGGFYGTVTTIFIILCSVIGALGAGGYMGQPITGMATSVPIIILTVAVANCVHLLVTLNHELHEGHEKIAAATESLRVNLQPVALASVTTAIGFLSMNFSEVPPFAHLGTQVSVGVLLSFIMAVTFLPAVMTALPIRARKTQDDDYRRMSDLADFVVRRQRLLLVVMSAAIIAAMLNIPRNEINDIFLHYFHESLPFRADTDFMIENLTGVDMINFSLHAGESGAISDPAFQTDVERFSAWLEQQPEVIHVDRFTQIMKRLNKNMHGDDAGYHKLPDDRDLSAQYLLLYEMSLPYGLDLNNQINVDKSQTKVVATIDILSSKQMIAFNERANTWLRDNAASVQQADSAGTSLMFAYAGQRNNHSMLIGTVLALIMISFVLVATLRSVRVGMLSLVPNLVPAAVAFGVWGIFVGSVGLSLSIVAGMTFGIVIDDSVHFLSKYLRARRENNLDSPAAVRYAFRTVGRALVVTSIILVAGFSVIASSKFAMNSDMGIMTAGIIAIALATVFLMLPPLLMRADSKTVSG